MNRLRSDLNSIRIIDLGLTDFQKTYSFQMGLVQKISQGLAYDTLIITEHKPVITIGRKSSRNNILKTRKYITSRGIEILDIDRGGDITYHAQGQIIVYPLFKLENEARDIHGFLDYLEYMGCNFVSQYGLTPQKKPGFRGIWVQDKKIGSIGIGVKKWVTYHGIAININTDMRPFSFIRPCGIDSSKMASLKGLLGREIDINDAKDRIKKSFKTFPFMAEAVNQV